MNDRDLLARLRAADPATRTDLDGVDPTAFNAMAQGILMTPRTPEPAPRRWRPLLVGGITVALVGGGAAFAITNYVDFYRGGALDGLTCQPTWQDPSGPEASDSYGGPEISGDPIADCARYAELTGRPTVQDPVAVRWHELLVVGPRAGMPQDARPLDPPPADAAAVGELDRSLQDPVDGGGRGCLSTAQARDLADAELRRLGLTGWTVAAEQQDPPGGECTFVFATPDDRTVHVRERFTNPEPELPLVGELRSQVAEQCLTLPQARARVEALYGTVDHWPTAATVDDSADCTRVDLEIGGSFQVFLTGPQG